ncbi:MULTISPECIES: RNA polymerase sigma factor [Dyadobacter]|uniref:Sigma-70 family RNA polymerase sigma factor n=1 Tax=Dyadobacter chenhuakuii TaxID=2909339 RepID=A0ABY4XJA9_9BACT|nr:MULTISPECIES: sigma-70 family RNA polymerase sigma factor [Dyadobacter]MCF2496215.1 sigma-70 family RNA polymerase sigma factor [Dyadobacter chenhuakuii]MCF2520624.1 sigma-70 family RNA polymerase sigma factor [Dyadobacter sp. CY351]USJ30278.1 sigma-70 family RNA polymerase sigma factor [Dyadobacter chenhuakuii]
MGKPTPIPVDELHLADLWNRFRQHDEQAFDELANRRYRLLFNYATKFTKDTELIKDCIQDLFLELWYRRTRLTDTSYVTVYLICALRNNLLRKLKLNNRLDDSADITVSCEAFTDNLTVETMLISSESMSQKEREIRNAINRLPARQQEVIFLKFYEGLSNDEIAKVMEIERQTVSNFIYRAISQLKNDLPSFSNVIPQIILIFFLKFLS